MLDWKENGDILSYGKTDKCIERRIGRRWASIKSMLKIVPQTTSSLSLSLESPGDQKHQDYSSLVRNTTFTSTAIVTLQNRYATIVAVGWGGRHGTLRTDTK